MSKYEPIRKFLEGADTEGIDFSFMQLEGILGFELPKSAYRHQAWWANELHGSHSHARSWQEAGWETCQVNTSRRTVRFERRRKRGSSINAPQSLSEISPGLWSQAHEITGIEDRDKLMTAALQLLIQREAGRQLILMGGTMPDLVVPERERPAT